MCPADIASLTITVKALGESTRWLYNRFEPGVESTIERLYGSVQPPGRWALVDIDRRRGGRGTICELGAKGAPSEDSPRDVDE